MGVRATKFKSLNTEIIRRLRHCGQIFSVLSGETVTSYPRQHHQSSLGSIFSSNLLYIHIPHGVDIVTLKIGVYSCKSVETCIKTADLPTLGQGNIAAAGRPLVFYLFLFIITPTTIHHEG